MILPLIRNGTSRFQFRFSRIHTFSTSPCQHSNGSLNDVFLDHDSPQPLLRNDAQHESRERIQLAEPSARRDSTSLPSWRQSKSSVTIGAPALAGSNPDVTVSDAFDEGSNAVGAGEVRHHLDADATKASPAHAQTDSTGSYLAIPYQEQDMSFSLAKKRLLEAIRLDDPQTLLVEFWEQSRDPAILAAIPATTFSEILRLLDRRRGFVAFFREYKQWHPKHYWKLLELDRQFHQSLQDCRTLYRDIWHRRSRSVGHMGVREYAGFLRLASNTWDGDAALSLMKDMLRRDVQPDLICYNLYFEARCWSDMWNPYERQLRRVIPYNQSIRKNHATRTSADMTIKGYRVEEGGLKTEVTRMFMKMIGEGTMADTTAFCHLMTALAREGDLDGVKSILRKIWDVDADATSEADNERQNETLIPKDSPVYPNQALLFIVAHVFGSNNDVPTAVRLVDHFSRKFEVRIPYIAWSELLEWAFVLSTRRYNINRVRGVELGRLPLDSIHSLWDVMTSKPYCIEPGMEMYDLMIRSMWRRSKIDFMLQFVTEGVKLAQRHLEQHRNLVRMKDYLEQKGAYGADAKDLSYYKRRIDVAHRRRFQSFVTVHKWFRLLLSKKRWINDRYHYLTIWERQGIPNVIKALWRYRAARGVRYSASTGMIHLKKTWVTPKLDEYLHREKEFEYQMETQFQDEADVETETEDDGELEDDMRPWFEDYLGEDEGRP